MRSESQDPLLSFWHKNSACAGHLITYNLLQSSKYLSIAVFVVLAISAIALSCSEVQESKINDSSSNGNFRAFYLSASKSSVCISSATAISTKT